MLVALSVACLWGNAYAAEGGKSLYLLGKRGPLAGLIPKPGWYLSNDVYVYSGGEPGTGWRAMAYCYLGRDHHPLFEVAACSTRTVRLKRLPRVWPQKVS